MATLVLGAAGAAIGGSIGGAILGVSVGEPEEAAAAAPLAEIERMDHPWIREYFHGPRGRAAATAVAAAQAVPAATEKN